MLGISLAADGSPVNSDAIFEINTAFMFVRNPAISLLVMEGFKLVSALFPAVRRIFQVLCDKSTIPRDLMGAK